jgi:cytochrome b
VILEARIRAWDLPTRIFHWTLALLAVFSFTTAKVGGSWMEWHLRSGYAVLTLLLFRVAWGFAGSETARFSHFVRGAGATTAYTRELLAGRARLAPGHNPLGGWMVLLMIAIFFAQALTGLFADDEIATQGPLAATVSNAWVSRLSAFHSYNQWAIAGVTLLHVSAIAFYRLRLGEELVGPMLHGWKLVPRDLRPPRQASSLLGAALLGASAAIVYWLVAIYPRSP